MRQNGDASLDAGDPGGAVREWVAKEKVCGVYRTKEVAVEHLDDAIAWCSTRESDRKCAVVFRCCAAGAK